MRFLEKLFGRKEKEKAYEINLQTPRGYLKLQPEDMLEKDPDARIEEFWIDAMDVSEDGYWLLVGRRHGVIQLYDWSGKLHRLPSRPPAQVITEALFKGSYLALITPPYLVVYLLEDRRNPQTWKSFRTTQEGLRASVGLDISGSLLAYGVVGERVYVIDISGGFRSEGLDFRSAFSYSNADIGELRQLRFVGQNRLLLSGSKGLALYDLGGDLVERGPCNLGSVTHITKDGVLLWTDGKLFMYDFQLGEPLKSLEVPMQVSQMDASPDGEFLFLADAQENRMGVVYLPQFQMLSTVEGFGYSVLELSPDGTIYTCIQKNDEERRLYSLVAVHTSLTDFLYDADRQALIIKRAEDELKNLASAIKKLSPDADPSETQEYKRLLSMDAPIRKLREVIAKGSKLVEDAKFENFLKGVRSKLQEDRLKGEDLKEVESRIKFEEGQRLESLQSLKSDIEEYFKKKIERGISEVESSIYLVEADDLRDLEALEVVKKVREFFSSLPTSFKEDAQSKLSKVLHKRLLQGKLDRYRIRIQDSKVFFGSEEFPKFSGDRRKLKWRLKVEDRVLIGDKIHVKISFEREDGVVVEPKRYNNLLRQEELRSIPLWVRRYLRHLNGLFATEFDRKPVFVSYEETPWFVKNLQKFSSLVKEQLMFSEGILILEGDAGVGKNFLVEVFCALTGRPLFIVPCNSKMEKEDITFVYEFDTKRGTKRVYSDLVKALQTPGAVIYFDEINTLPAGMVKLFNPLFDYRRFLTLPTGEIIKAHREVVFVGGMNPQNYLGVSELPQDIKSRADILLIDYPPFEDQSGLYNPDEAIILKDYVRELSHLNSEDFTYLWHWVINGLKVKEVEGTERLEPYVWKLFELLKIANEVRKAYRSYQMQQSEEPVDFVFSIRDTIRCARRLGSYQSVKSLVIDTILPKVSSPLEREILKSIVERS
ncbi:MAG: AAA family ATPase [Aquificaceae bacterium]|nr:AAA family ATPase [Aquificaceae bacterium]